jgi:hypothetical protein
MDRVELESQLLRLLSEPPRAALSPGTMAEPEPVSDGFAVESTMTERLTAEIVAANHRAGDAPGPWRHLPMLLPEVAGSTPVQMLETLTARFRDTPDHRNADLLQTAINRVTASETSREKHRKVVAQAKELLHTGEGLADPAVADDIWYEAYRDVDFGGPEYFTSMTPGWAYWRQPDFGQIRATYANVRMNDLISSIEFGSSATEAGGQVILFEHFRYEGRFVNFSVPSGGRRQVPWIGSDFNDLATSALIVRRWPNETPPVPVGSFIPAGVLTQAFNRVPRVRPNGNPVVTWDMWPIGRDGDGRWHPNAPERTFIHLIVPLRINLPDPLPGLWAEFEVLDLSIRHGPLAVRPRQLCRLPLRGHPWLGELALPRRWLHGAGARGAGPAAGGTASRGSAQQRDRDGYEPAQSGGTIPLLLPDARDRLRARERARRGPVGGRPGMIATHPRRFRRR